MICRKKASPQTLRRAGKSIFSHKGSEKLQFYRFFLVNSPKKEANPLSPLYGKDHFSHLSSICGKTSNRLSFFPETRLKKSLRTPERKRQAFGSCKSFAAERLFYAPTRGNLLLFVNFLKDSDIFRRFVKSLFRRRDFLIRTPRFAHFFFPDDFFAFCAKPCFLFPKIPDSFVVKRAIIRAILTGRNFFIGFHFFCSSF